MKYRFYTVSAEAWDAMLVAIQGAKHSIYWESYILLHDTPTHNFFEVLKEKACQGVSVKVIADALGSFWLSGREKKELAAAGVELLFFNHLVPWWNIRRFRHWWFCRNHRKVLIIDEAIGFVGGVNVGKIFSHWLDLHVELRGLIVRTLIRSFVKSYRQCGGRDRFILQKVSIPKTKIHFFDYWPSWRQRQSLKQYYRQHIQGARKEIIITTPYFFPHPWLVKVLHQACRRGVKIEIILPKATDSKLLTWANYIFAALVKKPGIDFYFSNEMIHAKSLLIDGESGWIGSHNLDAQSFDYNAENVLVFRRKDMVLDLKKILERWKQKSEKFYFNDRKRRWYQRLAEGFFKMLQPIL